MVELALRVVCRVCVWPNELIRIAECSGVFVVSSRLLHSLRSGINSTNTTPHAIPNVTEPDGSLKPVTALGLRSESKINNRADSLGTVELQLR